MQEKEHYNESDIQVLEGLEAVSKTTGNVYRYNRC